MEFLFELFKRIPRQGPGSEQSTLKALSKISLPDKPRVLDAGCGTGNQTLTLAKKLDADITAVDIHQPYLDILSHLAYHLKPKGSIETIAASMDDLPFPKNHFDLFWSEGAVYIIGFEKGLQYFQQFLKPGGYIAVTEISWFRNDAPDELKEFWQNEYPDIKTVDQNINVIKELGFELVDHFPLPASDWLDEFNNPLQQRIQYFRSQNLKDQESIEILDMTEQEIQLFKKYSDFYGYEFYTMKHTKK